MMKEMVYTGERILTVLHEGVYKGYRFCILSMGTHPTAYVECKMKNCNSYDDKRLEDVWVHGGFTYYGKAMWDTDDKKKYLGWDYAHFGDYVGYELLLPTQYSSEGEKWTTEKIYEEVRFVIEQLEIERKTSNMKATSLGLSVTAFALFAFSLVLSIVLVCEYGLSLFRILVILYNCVGLVGMTWQYLRHRRQENE